MDYEKWQNHIDNKKQCILDKIDSAHNLDNSLDNKKFIEVLKSIINCKIFNTSKFSFLAINLLVNSLFIDSEIIDNLQTDPNTSSNNTPETNLKNILNIIIDLVVQTEISLNYHCILICYFLNKAKEKNANTNKINIETSTIFNKFNTIDNENLNSLKSSTIILLFLKFVRKIGGYQHNTDNNNNLINKIINCNNNTNENFNVKKHSIISLSIKNYLDTFILNIDNYFDNSSNSNSSNSNSNSNNINIYSICSEYIISIVELLYNEFNYFFDILELSIILNLKYKKIEFTENKKIELNNIKNEIKLLINDEINICKDLFKL